MRKIVYLLFLSCILSEMALAAPGDSTWVQATNRRFDRGNGYGAYDTAVSFPNTSTTYRKIYMVFELGKYPCPGYDPNNPGDGAGQTGWCGDWDYTVENILMTPGGDTLELGRLITPYARQTWPRTPLTWTQRYIFDVTDYYPVLKGAATMRVFYSGYSTGFRGDVKFLFIEGTPERDVKKVERIWHGSFNYGATTPISAKLPDLNRTAPAGTASAEMKLNITGHGSDNNGCGEFCGNAYTVSLNGNAIAKQPFFRDDCGLNDLYPQSGTWVYSRANWCPGALVHTFSHTLNGVTAAANYTLGLGFPAYTSPGGGTGSYTIDGAIIYYGAMNHTLDAAIEDIVAPTNAEYHWRANPTATQPILMVRNSGSTPITSITFNYGVVGKMTQTYTWSGTLAPLSSQEIVFPPLTQLRLAAGNYGFSAKIVSVNSATDEEPLNNEMHSTFTAADTWPSEIQVQLKSNNEASNTNASLSQTAWKIEDANGNVLYQKSDCAPSSLCTSDTIRLAPGGYRLVVTDSAYLGYYDADAGSVVGYITGTGASTSFGGSSGYLRVYDVAAGGLPINLPGYFGGNFGRGFTQSFVVGEPVGVRPATHQAGSLKAFPNPASNTLSVVVDRDQRADGSLQLLDVMGRVVLHQSYSYGIVLLDVAHLAGGTYLLQYNAVDGVRMQQRVVLLGN
ncbi:MAG: T9SS type A sorting domain-containing protein [Bacteroidetes bacterium]|nr:T9SS type A sorting domain-containing protein [Bacteroidota bacterium]